MKTDMTVVDGKLSNEQLGALCRRFDEIKRRAEEKSINLNWVMNELQRIVEGRQYDKEVVIRALEKLAWKGTVTVRATSVDKNKFFSGKLGVNVWTSDRFDNVVKSSLPATIVCFEHQMDVFRLTANMWDSEIQSELGTKTYRLVEEVVASMVSRIMMWKDGKDGHNLLTNGYANIEHARAADGRIVAVSCSFDGSEWSFGCNGLDGNGGWDEGRQFSAPALGA